MQNTSQNLPAVGELDALNRPWHPDRFLPSKDKRGWWKPTGSGRPRKGERKPPRQRTRTPRQPATEEPSHALPESPETIPEKPHETMQDTTPPNPPPVGDETTRPPDPDAPDFSDVHAAAETPPTPDEAHNYDTSKLDGSPTTETIIGAIQTALVLIGDDEGILSDTEKKLLRRPLERVLKKYEVGDDAMPAELDLALVMAGVVIVRLQKPKTATFAAKVRAWFRRMWFRGEGEVLAHKLRRKVGPIVDVETPDNPS